MKRAPKLAPAAADPLGLRVQLGPPLTDRELPRCAIVILNLDGRHHLAPCFETLRALDYPADKLEVTLIDNASRDGSAAEMKRRHGWVRLVENARNVGFSAGCNQGARAAEDAELVVFLNNDMRVQPGWLRALASPVVRGDCAATTARMLSWDGKLMNSAGGGMNFHGIGIQRGYLEPPGPEYDVARRSLFACGGAMAMRRDTFLALGGFDESFFAYYEDVDLGWRTWLAGHEVWYVPEAVCYHHHSSTSGRMPRETIRLLQVRNPLLACFKNYDDQNLRRVLPALLALFLRRTWIEAGIADDRPFRIEHAGVAARSGPAKLLGRLLARARERVAVRRSAAADLIGVNDLLGHWDLWWERRRAVQALRAREDAEIFRLFLRPQWCIEAEPGFRELFAGLNAFLGIDEMFRDLTEAGPEPRG